VAIRPSFAVLLLAVVTDWIDGPLARRRPRTGYGGRFDLEADSILTLGASIAAVRIGAPRVVVLAPLARYAVPALRTGRLDPDGARRDRITGVAQMVVLAAAVAPWPLRVVRILALPVSAARCAAMLVQAKGPR
jgi:phosphatidylglycerophosphate synthase